MFLRWEQASNGSFLVPHHHTLFIGDHIISATSSRLSAPVSRAVFYLEVFQQKCFRALSFITTSTHASFPRPPSSPFSHFLILPDSFLRILSTWSSRVQQLTILVRYLDLPCRQYLGLHPKIQVDIHLNFNGKYVQLKQEMSIKTFNIKINKRVIKTTLPVHHSVICISYTHFKFGKYPGLCHGQTTNHTIWLKNFVTILRKLQIHFGMFAWNRL